MIGASTTPALSILSSCSIVYSFSRSKQNTESDSLDDLFSPPMSRILVVLILMAWNRLIGEGINSFIVRIRDDKMKPCQGVMIEDMGWKIGLNGIDNGRLSFDHVKVTREAMLNAFNDVTEDGKFVSDIPKPSARFFKVADRLLSGRLCIAGLSIAGCKQVILHAIRYSQQRLAVGQSGESDTPIMSY